MSNMVVNTNTLALNSHRSMKRVGNDQAKSSAKLSSGERINTAADDAADLAISEKMRSQIRGLDQASRNSQDAISLVQTADGGLPEVHNMVQRARELTVQAGNDTYTASDREKVQLEIDQLAEETTAMASKVQFNGMKLLDGSAGAGGKLTMQVGANASETLEIDLTSANITNLNLRSGTSISVADTSSASSALVSLDSDLETISVARANLGAYQNRLEYTVKALDISSENLSSSESQIRDTDMAKEMMNLTKANTLQSAAMNMLGQANQDHKIYYKYYNNIQGTLRSTLFSISNKTDTLSTKFLAKQYKTTGNLTLVTV